MSIPESETFKPNEVEKQREANEALENPELDRTSLMSERVALDKDDETRTRVKKFTVGDGGFGIEGLDQAKEKAGNKEAETMFGAGIKRDDSGRPTEIEYPDGRSNRIKYDESGNIEELKTAEGKTVTRDGDHWSVVDSNGTKTQFKGDIHVTKDGDVAVMNPDGSGSIRHSDGSKTRISEDGVSQETRDINERVTSVTYPDGKTNKIEYDENGEVKAMKTAEGKTVTREGDHWSVTDANGKKSEWKGDVHVTEDGDVAVINPDGSGSIRHADGSKTRLSDDGVSQETRDIHDRVTSITYPDGNTNKVEYDEKGEVKGLQTAEGKTVVREGDHWSVTDADGNKSEWKGDVVVTDKGEIIVLNEDGSGAVRNPDGSKDVIGPN
jgi:YD repeat-containing protein